MSEANHDDLAAHGSEHDDAGQDRAERTGNETVDAVLESMAELEERPVVEHVAVFESAHDRLRAALTDAGSATPRD